MDAALKEAIRKVREQVPASGRPRKVELPPADARPRFAKGPLAGKLKDRRARMEEALGLDDPAGDEWFAEALRDPAWKAQYDLYEREFGAQVAQERFAARAEEGYATAAKRLGVEVDQLKDSGWIAAHAAELAARDHNARVRDQMAELEAQLRPLPEPEPTA